MQHLWKRSVQVLTNPVEAFTEMCAAPDILWALVIVALSQLALTAGAHTPGPGTAGFDQVETPGLNPLLSAIITVAAFWVGTWIIQWTAVLLGGEGSHGALLTALGFASLPGLFQSPLYLLAQVGLPATAVLGQLAIGVWTIVLDVIALRVVHRLSTARSVLALFLSIVALLLVLLVLAVIVGLFFGPI